jgi:hypothetical protein
MNFKGFLSQFFFPSNASLININFEVHSRLGYHKRNHDTHLFHVLSFKAKIQQNECFEMLNNERGICMFRLSINKFYND